MTSLEERLKDPDYKAWVKAGVCLGFVKAGLEQFAANRSTLFHQGVLNQLQNKGNPSRQNVCSQATVRRGRVSCCYNCQCFVDEIDSQNNYSFKFQQGNWDNSDIQLWPKEPWEMAKVFMNPGQKATQKSPADTDLSGILNFIDHCCIAKQDIVNAFNISKVRDSRNKVMHSSSMKLSHSDFINFVDAMIDLLEDPGPLGKMPGAQEAVRNIQEVKAADFYISKEAEFKVLTNRTEVMQLILKLLQKDVLTIKTYIEAAGLEAKENTKSLEELEKSTSDNIKQIKQQIETLQTKEKEAHATIESLKDIIEHDKDLKDKLQDQVKDIATRVEEISPGLQGVIQDVSYMRNKLDSLENQMKIQKEEGIISMTRQTAVEDRQSLIEEQVHELQMVSSMLNPLPPEGYKQEVEKLQDYLVEEYKSMGFEISLSPIYEGLNEDVMKVDIDSLYTDLVIVKDEKKEEVPLRSYKEIFHKNEKRNRTIIIKGEAGVGKSTWCMQLVYIWSKLHDKNCEGTRGTERGNHNTANARDKRGSVKQDIEEALYTFKLLIYVPLRYVEGVKGKALIKDIIFSSTLERLSNFRSAVRRVIETQSEKVLIILDGLDEFAYSLSYDGLNQCTIISTTRAWKYDLICSQSPKHKVDKVLKLKGLNETGVRQLTQKVYTVFHDSKGTEQSSSNSTENIQDQVNRFLNTTIAIGLTDSVKIPLVLIIILESYFENGYLSPSLTCNLISLVEILLARGEQKLTDSENTELENLQRNWSKEERHSQILLQHKELSGYSGLLERLSYLAYTGITNLERENSLIFTEEQLRQYFSAEELQICFRFGFLAKSRLTTSLLRKKKLCISFYHKLVQEFFAAIWIVCNDTGLCDMQQLIDRMESIFEMENIIRFVCGLSPQIGSKLTKHFLAICDEDTSVNEMRGSLDRNRFSDVLYRFSVLLLRCQTEVSLSSVQSEPLYISDICLYSGNQVVDPLLRLLSSSVHYLKSLHLYHLDISPSDWCKLLQIINSSVCLQTLAIELSCSTEVEGERLYFDKVDFSKHSQLKRFFVERDMLITQPALLPLIEDMGSAVNINSLQLLCIDSTCSDTLLATLPGLENLEFLLLNTVTFTSTDLVIQNKKLKSLHLDKISFIDSCLVLRDVHGLEIIHIKKLQMPSCGWTGLVDQFRNQVKLQNLELEEIHSEIGLLCLDQCSHLVRLSLSDLETAGIRLANVASLMVLNMIKVGMPSASWCEFFKFLRHDNLIELKLIKLDIGEVEVDLKLATQLQRLTISYVKTSLDTENRNKQATKSVKNTYVWEKMFNSLPTESMQQLYLFGLDIGKTKFCFANSKHLKLVVIEEITMSKESFKSLHSSMSDLPSLKLVEIRDVNVDGASADMTLEDNKLVCSTVVRPEYQIIESKTHKKSGNRAKCNFNV